MLNRNLFALTLVMILTAAACGGDDDSKSSDAGKGHVKDDDGGPTKGDADGGKSEDGG